MSFIVAINVVASQPPELGPTGTPTGCANFQFSATLDQSVVLQHIGPYIYSFIFVHIWDKWYRKIEYNLFVVGENTPNEAESGSTDEANKIINP